MHRSNEWLIPAALITVVALILAFTVRAQTGYQSLPDAATSLTIALLIAGVSAIARSLIFVWRLWRGKVANPIKAMMESAPHAARYQAVIMLTILLVTAFLFSTTFLKSMLPTLVPFWADAPLSRIDRWMGVDGEALALWLKGLLPLIGIYYGLWHLAHLGGILWVVHWRDPAKGRFILSYMLTWGLGMIAAFIFSSAGPFFLGTYDLSIAPPSVQMPAHLLWANYKAGGAVLGGGISAFPSLHVAIAAWLALALRHRGWRIIGAVYTASIYACSVILGWHYVLDGAAGILIALAASTLARRVADIKWFARSDPSKAYGTELAEH